MSMPSREPETMSQPEETCMATRPAICRTKDTNVTWKPRVRALALKESATRRNSTTLYSEYSPSSATILLDRGT